jgi:hypothetical protein
MLYRVGDEGLIFRNLQFETHTLIVSQSPYLRFSLSMFLPMSRIHRRIADTILLKVENYLLTEVVDFHIKVSITIRLRCTDKYRHQPFDKR